jgi:anti-sigma factor RsiW
VSGDRARSDDRCVELVELLTAYLDDAVDPATRDRFDEHLRGCPGCRAALSQWRSVIGLAGRLSTADVEGLDPFVRARLLSALVVPRRR